MYGRSRPPLRAAVTFALALAGCPRTDPRPRRAPPPPPAPTQDTGPAPRTCAIRAAPPTDLRLAPDCGPPQVAWNGTNFGVVWVEPRDGEPAVSFVRLDAEGALLGTPQRVSERGFHAASPTLAWNGASWSVIYSGGIRALGDLYQARVDSRGIPLGRPWRMTRGARQDLEPVLISTGPGSGLAWIAQEETGRWSLYVQPSVRWGDREVPPTKLMDTGLTLGAPSLAWTGRAWAAAALASSREVRGLLLMRMEVEGAPRGVLTRLTRAAPGGTETSGRYAFAWDGGSFVAAWSELRDGVTQVFRRRYDNRGAALGDEVSVALGDATSASAPALTRVGDGVLALATQVEREGSPRVRVWLLGSDDALQSEFIEVQGIDAQAMRPSMAWAGGVLGVATVSPRGVAFHTIGIGTCQRRDPSLE